MLSQQTNTLTKYADLFVDQRPLLGVDGLGKVKTLKAVVAGAGGGGNPVTIFAARSGIETVCLIDPQTAEVTNRNRIFAASRHEGLKKVHIVRELLESFDRLGEDPDFKYVPLECRVEDPAALPYLQAADVIVACQGSVESRLWLLQFARTYQKLLLNVGFGCEPGRFMGGEISIYRPDRPGQACPACISLHSGLQPTSTFFFPPLCVLAALTVQLIVAEAVGFDLYGDERPNYVVFDAFRYSLGAYLVPADPNCQVCRK